MLSPKLLSGATSIRNIEFVGQITTAWGTSGTDSTGTTTRTHNLNGTLTGGSETSPKAGDIVIVFYGVSRNNTSSALDIQGYGIIHRNYQNYLESSYSSTPYSYLVVGYKVMGSVPDTSVTTVQSNGYQNNEASAVTIQVWRNVDPSQPVDVFTRNIKVTTDNIVNPPAVTPATEGSYILVAGFVTSSQAGNSYGLPSFTSSDLSVFRTASARGPNPTSSGTTVYTALIGVGYKQHTGGTFDPATFGYSGATILCGHAITMALRPAGKVSPGPYPINSNALTTSTSAGTLTIPSHQSGDWIVLMEANKTLTPPALRSGYTNITTFQQTAGTVGTDTRSARVSYIVSNGSISSLTIGANGYGIVSILRNVTSVGQVAVKSGAAGAYSQPFNVYLPSISNLSKGSLLLASSYVGTVNSYIRDRSLGFYPLVGSIYYYSNAQTSLTNSTTTGPAMTFTASVSDVSWIGEFK